MNSQLQELHPKQRIHYETLFFHCSFLFRLPFCHHIPHQSTNYSSPRSILHFSGWQQSYFAYKSRTWKWGQKWKMCQLKNFFHHSPQSRLESQKFHFMFVIHETEWMEKEQQSRKLENCWKINNWKNPIVEASGCDRVAQKPKLSFHNAKCRTFQRRSQ